MTDQAMSLLPESTRDQPANLTHTQTEKECDKVADKKIVVSICSGWNESEVQGLIKKIKDMKDVVSDVKYVGLKVENIKQLGKTSLKNIDVMLLCHSSKHRRKDLTDVEGSLYDDLLCRAKYKLGKKRVGVFVYDDDEWKKYVRGEKIQLEVMTFPTLHKKTSLCLVCGRLSAEADGQHGQVDMTDEQLLNLRHFLHDASDTPISCCCHRRCRSDCC